MRDKNSSGNKQRADLQAAAMLRASNAMTLDASSETAISAVAAEMDLTRIEVIRLAVREWLTTRESARFPAGPKAPSKSLAPVRSDVPD